MDYFLNYLTVQGLITIVGALITIVGLLLGFVVSYLIKKIKVMNKTTAEYCDYVKAHAKKIEELEEKNKELNKEIKKLKEEQKRFNRIIKLSLDALFLFVNTDKKNGKWEKAQNELMDYFP